jgi:hypothetical protein
MGIEPTAQAWEAWVLPLYDARSRRILDNGILVAFRAGKQIIAYPKKEGRPAAPFPS